MKEFRYGDIAPRGRVVRLDYMAPAEAGGLTEKYANVYLPCAYDEEPGRRFNVLYLMHGGGGNPDAWLDSCPTKNLLDTAFAKNEAEPFIAVFPSYYTADHRLRREQGVPRDWERTQTLAFQRELREVLIPAVEGAFRTYAEDVTEEGLTASRMHRAFGGFSMGGVTTWFAFLNNLDLIGTFLPLSGDCWEAEPLGGKSRAEETAQILREHAAGKEFRILAATGTEDIAYPALTSQIEAMKPLTDAFTFSEDPSKGNLSYLTVEGWEHSYPRVMQYLGAYLKDLFS